MVVVAATAGLMSGASAQVVSDSDTPQAGLDLPANLQIFGKADPNVRKATAIVNNVVITGTDVDQRLNMIAAFNKLEKLSASDRDQLRLRILRQLIDETLEIQEAKSNDITIEQAQLENSFARVARNFNRTPDQMRSFLRQIGSSDRSLKRQIEGELAWNRLLQRKVTPNINVSDEEVNAIIQQLQESKGTEEYHLAEIYMSATPERTDQVVEAMRKIIEQIKQGQSFEALAQTYSEATTRAVGGDLGWIRLNTLPQELQNAATQMQVGQIAGPVQVPGGFSILYLSDKRQVGAADPRSAKLNLRQMTIKFPAGTTQAQASSRAAEFAKATQAMQGCGAVTKTAAQTGAEVIDNDSLRIRDLPPALQDIMLKLQVGQATPPFGSVDEGVRVLVLCGRDEAVAENLPSADQVREQVEEQRVNLRAQRMLRDLRRDALVEYR